MCVCVGLTRLTSVSCGPEHVGASNWAAKCLRSRLLPVVPVVEIFVGTRVLVN